MDEIDSKKHRNNLLKTVEGTAWILCDALHTMSEHNIMPDGTDVSSQLAQNISEIYEVIAECEEPAVIEHTADKMLEFMGQDKEKLKSYINKYMKDNAISEAILRKIN